MHSLPALAVSAPAMICTRPRKKEVSQGRMRAGKAATCQETSFQSELCRSRNLLRGKRWEVEMEFSKEGPEGGRGRPYAVEVVRKGGLRLTRQGLASCRPLLQKGVSAPYCPNMIRCKYLVVARTCFWRWAFEAKTRESVSARACGVKPLLHRALERPQELNSTNPFRMATSRLDRAFLKLNAMVRV